ncbi:hypothetical protein D3C72_1342050 [compost metagenome]
MLREARHQPYDIVVVNNGGGEEHELEVELVNCVGFAICVFTAFVLLCLEALCRFQIGTAEAQQTFFGQNVFDGGGIIFGEVGVLV